MPCWEIMGPGAAGASDTGGPVTGGDADASSGAVLVRKWKFHPFFLFYLLHFLTTSTSLLNYLIAQWFVFLDYQSRFQLEYYDLIGLEGST